MSTVYIIGNGFDLNLGLKTSYKDFIASDIFKNKVGQGNELLNYLQTVNSNSNWIDVEKELEIYSKRHASELFLNEYKELCATLKQYIKSIDLSKMDTKSSAYNLFSSTDPYDTITIINFNYTKTVSHIFESSLYDDHDDVNIIHVHGSIESDEIIFGVDDKANIDKDHTFLYKSTSPIYNGRDCINALNNFERLHVFGHSLGESDHMYLNCFQELSSYVRDYSKEINIYHYGEEDNYKIHKQLHKLTFGKVSALKNNTNVKIIDLKK